MRPEPHDLADLIDDRPNDEHFAYHRSALTSEAIHRLELQHIFMRTWLYLGHESEVPEPGDFVRRSVAEAPLFFVRSRTTGEVRVFANSCTHRGATICRRDRGNAKSFQCFYHAWTFDTRRRPDRRSGRERLRAEPGTRSQCGLVPVPRERSRIAASSSSASIADVRGALAITSPARASTSTTSWTRRLKPSLSCEGPAVTQPTAEGLGGPARGASRHARYGIKANWKLLVENSFDGYHLGPTHATYFQFLKDQNVDVSPSTGTMKLLGNGHAVIEYTGSWGRPVAKWSPAFGEDVSRRSWTRCATGRSARSAIRGHRMAELNRNLFIYPNLFVMDNNATRAAGDPADRGRLHGCRAVRARASGRGSERASRAPRELRHVRRPRRSRHA